VLHGQWSNPSLISLRGRDVALFGGGDGWLYALEAANGREVWRFDGNAKDAVWCTGGDVPGKVFRNNIIASPLVYENRIYLAMGQDPKHGQGRGRVHAIDPGGQGDVTASRKLWETTDVGRTIATPIAHEGLLYVADFNGWVHCFETSTGKKVWEHDLFAGVWGCFLLADGKLYVGDEDGAMTIFAIGREKKVIGQIEMDAALWSPPCAFAGVLYVASARCLYALGLPKPADTVPADR
jgi:outer membrane protein assembly factor BamB